METDQFKHSYNGCWTPTASDMIKSWPEAESESRRNSFKFARDCVQGYFKRVKPWTHHNIQNELLDSVVLLKPWKLDQTREACNETREMKI